MEQFLSVQNWAAVVLSIALAIATLLWLRSQNGRAGSIAPRMARMFFSRHSRVIAARKLVFALLLLMGGALVLLGASILHSQSGIFDFVGGAVLVFWNSTLQSERGVASS